MLAADQVRVSKDWAYKLRRRDAAFDAAFREAEARERLAASPHPCPSPSRGGENYSGPEVVLQRGNGRRVQVKRARPDQWAEWKAQAFLTALAGTCNVKMSAAAVGTSAASAHARRRLDPDFALAWSQALEIGYVRLQANLIEAACCFFEGEVVPDENSIRTMSVAEAIQSLNMNKFAVTGEGKGRPGRR